MCYSLTVEINIARASRIELYRKRLTRIQGGQYELLLLMRSQEGYFQRKKNSCILPALPSVEAMKGGRFQLSSTVLKALKCV